MAINKVVYAGETLLDVSGTTVSENNLLSGATAINSLGEEINGGVVVTNTWVGTLAEYEAQKDSIPNDTYISIIDDEVDSMVLDDSDIKSNKGWSSNKINMLLQTKLNGFTVESKNIPSSQTSVIFTDARIGTNSIIDVYDSIFGLNVSNITVEAGKCTVTIPAQSSTHDMKIVVI